MFSDILDPRRVLEDIFRYRGQKENCGGYFLDILEKKRIVKNIFRYFGAKKNREGGGDGLRSFLPYRLCPASSTSYHIIFEVVS